MEPFQFYIPVRVKDPRAWHESETGSTSHSVVRFHFLGEPLYMDGPVRLGEIVATFGQPGELRQVIHRGVKRVETLVDVRTSVRESLVEDSTLTEIASAISADVSRV